MPNIHLNCKKPKTCDTCRFNEMDPFKPPVVGWCILLNESITLTKIKKRKKECPFNAKKTILKKFLKEIKKCLTLKKKPKSSM